MSLTVSLALLSIIQGRWRVDEAPLVPDDWLIYSAQQVNEQVVAVLADKHPTARPDASVPIETGVFTVRIGEAPRLIARFSEPLEASAAGGSGFTLTVGQTYFRVRLDPTPTLVRIGQFTVHPRAVSCDDAVHDCVFVLEEGLVQRWRDGTVSTISTPLSVEEGAPLVPWGAAMHPRGGLVALAASDAVVIWALETGKVTAVSGALTVAKPSLLDLATELEGKPALRAEWDRHRDVCKAEPTGWHGDKPVITFVEAFTEDVGAFPCPVTPSEFELDLRTHQRIGLPAYPWKVLDCPNGGWTSPAGTMVTDCTDPDEATSIRMMKQARAAAQKPIRELPEAVGLSETQVFVMELEPKHPYRWYRGAAKGQGLPFIVDGPSVLTFGPRGVTVEQVPWRFGFTRFAAALSDDWHLIESTSRGWALVRLTHDS